MPRAFAVLPAVVIALVLQPATPVAPPMPTMTPAAPPGAPAASSMPQPPSMFGPFPRVGAPGSEMPAEIRRQMADFQQLFDQQRQFRRSLLAAITPEHRALLSRIVGEMAIADDPDQQTAAAQLNAALSPAEQQAVITTQAAQQAAISQRFAQMAAAQAQQSPLPQHPAPPPNSAGIQMPVLRTQIHQGQVISGGGSAGITSFSRFAGIDNDAGSILLRTAVSMLGISKVLMNGVMPVNGIVPVPSPS